ELSEQDQFAIAKRLNAETHQTVFFSKINYGKEIIGKGVILPVSDLTAFEVVLVTGIANTKTLTTFLDTIKIHYHHKKYADHYNFSQKDVDEIKLAFSKIKTDKKLILTTEKDYVRSFMGMGNFYYLPIETVFIDHQEDFNKLIKKYVEQSSRNS
ncbi:MAG: tetraacyldisaccharide 4'-kinase, partial [Aureibaculum sp.]|nr:tetraacyldisaccharide 4'-kinase [Aureibaculum sp.]